MDMNLLLKRMACAVVLTLFIVGGIAHKMNSNKSRNKAVSELLIKKPL